MTATPVPPVMTGFRPSAGAGASWAAARTVAFGTTRPDWSATVTMRRPRRG